MGDAVPQACGDSSALPPCDVSRLDYTRRDWSRWDSFDLTRHSLVRRRTHQLGLDDARTTDSAEESYYALFREGVYNNFFKESYMRFRWLHKEIGSCDDFHAHLGKEKQLLVEAVLAKVGFAMNQEWNHWRDAQRRRALEEVKAAAKQAGGQAPNAADLDAKVEQIIDSTPFDFRHHPQCRPTIDWLHKLLDLHLAMQCTDESNTKSYGLWSEKDGSFQEGGVYWRAPGIGFLYGHFLHLLEDDMIRRLRCATYASLAAQYRCYLVTGPNYPHHLESQWLLRVAGWVQAAFVLLRGESELRSRGSWSDGVDGVVHETVREKGRFTTPDLLAFTEELAEEFCGRMRRVGQTEFQSSYIGYVQDLVCQIMLHAPSQKLYDSFASVHDRLTWDLIASLLPGCGTFPGPTSRSYDLFAGAHNAQDRLDYHHLKHVFRPHCDREEVRVRTRVADGAEDKRAICLSALLTHDCDLDGGPPTILAPTGNMDQNIYRLFHLGTQLAGLASVPFPYLRDLQLRGETRLVEQRYSHVHGQERSNFFTRRFQIGFAGEDITSIATGVYACARLAGAPVPGAPVAIVNHGDTHCTSMLRLYAQVGQVDDPFQREHRLDVAGKDRLALTRQVAVQHQAFMLVTSLLAPRCEMRDEEVRGSWNSCLVLPINCDAVFADDVRLPTEVGTFYRLPPGVVLTVRHGGASIAVRLVSFTHDDNVPDAERIEPSPERPTPGRQPCTLTWQVDESSVQAGCGRVTAHHRHAQEAGSIGPPLKAYRAAWLWGGGATRDDDEQRWLTRVLREAVVRESVTGSNWNEHDQPRNTYPPPYDPASVTPVGEQRWTLDTSLAAGALTLSVHRTDVYQPWQHDDVYKHPRSGPIHRAPYYFKDVRRDVNGVPTLEWRADGGEDPYRYTAIKKGELFEPHRAGGNTRVTRTQPTSFAELA